MKLSWKLFFITAPVFVLFLTIFGTWIIQDSFSHSLEQEISRSMAENQMFQNSYELTRNSLSEAQWKQTNMKKLVESFHRGGSAGSGARIYNASGRLLYQDNSLMLTVQEDSSQLFGAGMIENREESLEDAQTSSMMQELSKPSERASAGNASAENTSTGTIPVEKKTVDETLIASLDEEHNVCYMLCEQEDARYIAVVSRCSNGEFIETMRDISNVYANRDAMYARYQAGILFLTFVVGGIMLGVIFLLMRNIKKLSGATRQFARGKLDVRVHVRSRDEIGRLADDFNWMADAMKMQMQHMEGEVHRQEEFTAAFAHELKTPLTSIIGYADTIRQMDLSKEETDMCADYIFHQGKRLQTLSYKLLELAMAGRKEIPMQKIPVVQLADEIRRTAEVSLREKQITLYTDLDDAVIYGDCELLASLFLNLIDNARKAAAPGTKIFLNGHREMGGYLITVKDQGRGIPKEELSRITEAFYMVDKSRSRKEGGAGLGLALCKKIVELHRASWRFESEPGEGLTVSVMFWEPERPQGRRMERRKRQRS